MARKGLWYHGWTVVAMCMVAQTVALVLTLNCLSMFMPVWTREFGVPVSTLALGVTLFSATTAVLCYGIGILSARYSARLLYGIGLTILGLAHLLVAASHHVWQILAIYGIMLPFALGLCGTIISQGLVARWFVRRVGLAMGLTAAGLALPGLLFPPIIVVLMRVADWRQIWTGMGLVILLVVLPATLIVLRARTDADDAWGYVPAERRHVAAGAALPLGTIVRRANFWVIVLGFIAVQIIPMMLYVNITPIILSYGGSVALAGGFLMAFSLTAMAAKLTAGWMADRIGNRAPFALAAFGAGAGVFLLDIPGVNIATLMAAAVAIGFAGATWTLLASSILAEFGPASFGRAFGLGSAFATLSTFSAPIVARLHEASGSYTGPLTGLGVIALAAGVAFLVLYRPQVDELPNQVNLVI